MLQDDADKLAREASPDPELRERMGLRGRVSLARYLNVNAREVDSRTVLKAS